MSRNRFPSPSIATVSMDEYQEQMENSVRGQEPGTRGDSDAKREAPGPTLSSPESYMATNQRAPFLEPQELSKPRLEDGVAWRQKL